MQRNELFTHQLDGAPQGAPATPDILPVNPEYPRVPLSQMNFAVTGGNRDVGKGFVKELINAGVTNIGSSYNRERSTRIADGMSSEAATVGVNLQFVRCDLSTPEGQQAIFDSWENDFGNKIDGLVINTSGPGAAINVDASAELIDRFLQLRATRKEAGETVPEGIIVFNQSIPGHFIDRLAGAVNFSDYYETEVAPHKLQAEQNLMARLPELTAQGVRVITEVFSGVEKGTTLRGFEQLDRGIKARSRQLSEMLGLPLTAEAGEAGAKFIELAAQKDLPQGHVEFFAPVQDAREVFGDVYGNNAIYLTTVNAREGIGYLIANPAVHGEEPEIALVGSSPYHPDGPQQISLAEYIEKKHMEGHFKDDTGVAVFPGIKSLRQMAQAGEWLLQSRLDQDIPYRLTHYDGVTFTTPILPDTTIEVDAALTETGAVDAVVKVGEKVAATVKGMSYESIGSEEQEAEALSPFQLLEAAAQTFGAHVLHSQENADIVPLFMSTQQAEFKTTVNTGDSLVFRAEKTRSVRNIHEGNVKIVRQTFTGEGEERQVHEEEIGSIQKIRLALIPREQAIDLLKPVA